jgi:hypothetical protein
MKLNAILTEDVVSKYLNLKDQAPALADADNAPFFSYELGNNNDVFDLAISASNLAYKGTTTGEDFVLSISGGNGNDTLSTAIYAGVPNSVDYVGTYGPTPVTSDGLWLADGLVINDEVPWYLNSQKNANLKIDAGAGDDLVNTFGSGDWIVNLGTGNDTYYADNTGHTRGDSTAGTADSTGRATWVFNTDDQATPGAVVAERQLDDLLSDTDDSYIDFTGGSERGSLYGLKLRVVFEDVNAGNTLGGAFISKVVDVPAIDKYKITDLNINQAIIAAINTDPVLSKLLIAEAGRGNTLVVRALSDGEHAVENLKVEFSIPSTATLDAYFTTAEIAAWKTAVGATGNWINTDVSGAIVRAFEDLTATAPSAYNGIGPSAGSTYGGWFGAETDTDYQSAWANTGSAVITGKHSTHVSDNRIDSGAGNDVIVLSTGYLSNDTIVYTGTNNGFDTIVNFADNLVKDTPTSAVFYVSLKDLVAEGDGVNAPSGGNVTYTLNVNGNTLTATIGSAANNFSHDADDIGGAFDTAYSSPGIIGSDGTAWAASYNGTDDRLEFTQNGTSIVPPLITVGNNLTIDYTYVDWSGGNPAALSADIQHQGGAAEGDPGTDYLDFTSYGVNAVYLDNSSKYDITHTALDSPGLTVDALANDSLTAGTPPSTQGTLNTIAGGAKYIVMKQLYSDDTIYEITLWQDQASTGTGHGIAVINGTGIDTLLGTIGTVDFGKELDATWFDAADSVLL